MQNNQNKTQLIHEWVVRADDDELNIKSILKHRDGTPANVCFLSQQIAEKYLKALLLFYTGDYPKTHDLNQLTTLLGHEVSSIAQDFEEEIIILNPYYVGTRYPADIPIESFTWEMAEKAYEAAKRIKEFALEKMRL